MESKRMPEAPESYKGYESTELEERELKYFASLGLEKLWYWYGTQPYEGAGVLIGLKDGKYYVKDIGHCSCYGPTGVGISSGDDWLLPTPYETLDDILSGSSDEYNATSIKPLVEFVRANI